MYENHHVDLGLALRRLGDETMVVELTDFLVDGQGYFQQTAYRFLAGNIGLRAYEIGRQRMVEQKSANSFSRSSLITTLLGAEVPLDDVLPMIMSDPFILQSSLDALLYMDTRQTAEALVAAFPRPSHHDVGQYRARILDALCRIGDRRGLTLAADNPLLFASVAKYLPEADPVDFPAGHLEYNRIEEAMRVANWYRQHAEALKWDAKSGTFRLAAATP
jgi:hypothetical protein